MDHWTTWSSFDTCICTGSGYLGKKHRSRDPITYPDYGGKPCLSTNGEVLPKNYEREEVPCTKKDIEIVCHGQERRVLGIIITIFFIFIAYFAIIAIIVNLLQFLQLFCNYSNFMTIFANFIAIISFLLQLLQVVIFIANNTNFVLFHFHCNKSTNIAYLCPSCLPWTS